MSKIFLFLKKFQNSAIFEISANRNLLLFSIKNIENSFFEKKMKN